MVFVDLDSKRLLGIVRGTTGEAAKQALSMFPNLEIVSRDRGTAMASAAKSLGKTSVADRFHITDNMHDAIERTLHESLPKSMYIPVGDSWVYLSNDAESGEMFVTKIPATLTEDGIKQRARMARLSAKAEKTYRDTLDILKLTLQGKPAQEISNIMGIPAENVRKLRSNMRETISDVEKKIDEFVTDPHGSMKQQKSVSRSAQHSSRSIVEPYRETVVAMLKEGKSRRVIHEEICKLGFKGSRNTVDNYIIKLEREDSIDSDIKDKRAATKDYFGSIPDRPEHISVRIYSIKTVYNRILAEIREHREASAGKKQDEEANTKQGLVKKNAIPASNRTKIPLELVDILNWRDIVSNGKKHEAIDYNLEKDVNISINAMYPVFGHMVQFGIDYHNFMDNNDPAGLREFINKYKDDSYWRLAKFANGLQKDFEAVQNTLLYPDISNGLVEGINSIIKCDKRVCGGRAKIDLLTTRTIIRQNINADRGFESTA
jgi:hypothetical protein